MKKNKKEKRRKNTKERKTRKERKNEEKTRTNKKNEKMDKKRKVRKKLVKKCYPHSHLSYDPHRIIQLPTACQVLASAKTPKIGNSEYSLVGVDANYFNLKIQVPPIVHSEVSRQNKNMYRKPKDEPACFFAVEKNNRKQTHSHTMRRKHTSKNHREEYNPDKNGKNKKIKKWKIHILQHPFATSEGEKCWNI